MTASSAGGPLQDDSCGKDWLKSSTISMYGQASPARLTLAHADADHGMCIQTNPVVKQFYDCLVSGQPLQDDSWQRWQREHPTQLNVRSPTT